MRLTFACSTGLDTTLFLKWKMEFAHKPIPTGIDVHIQNAYTYDIIATDQN